MRRDGHYRPILVEFGQENLKYFDKFEKKIRVLIDGEYSKEESLLNDGTVSIRTTEEDLYSVEFFIELVKAINIIICR